MANLKSWFLGPQGENVQLMHQLTATVVDRAAGWRGNKSVAAGGAPSNGPLEQRVIQLLNYLEPRTVPAYSSRYQAHMGWDLMMPGIIGQVIGLLFPSNNVAYEGSPGTTALEMLVGRDLCRMLGFPSSADLKPWGHLVGGGTVGNIEALWAARGLKFLPLALKETLTKRQAEDPDFSAVVPKLELKAADKLLVEATPWELLNVPIDESLALPRRVRDLLNRSHWQAFDNALNRRSVNQRGLHSFLGSGVGAPKILLSHDNHYSLEKAVALLGLGQDCLVFVAVDGHGRMDMDQLVHQLDACVRNHEPVLAVVANLGSTELGAVDDLENILRLRTALQGKLDFMVHVDASFGGYHACLLHDDLPLNWQEDSAGLAPPPVPDLDNNVPEIGFSAFVMRQYQALRRADSVTVDPHKLGFMPYPGGAICYRNSALRDLTKFSAPYLGAIVPQGIEQVGERTDQFMGVFGVEGSKPGGAAAAVFLTHSLLRPTKAGYGQLSGKELYASKRVFAALLSLNGQDSSFVVAAAGDTAQQERLVEIAAKADSEVDSIDKAVLAHCGPDLNLVCYLFNFRLPDSKWNQDLVWLNVFNLLIYGALQLEIGKPKPLAVARTIFAAREGTAFIGGMLGRLNMASPHDLKDTFELVALRSAEWNPWLTEQDPTLKIFRDQVSQAAKGACDKVYEVMQRFGSAVEQDRALGLSEFVIGTGVVGALMASQAAQQSEEFKNNPVRFGLKLIMKGLALPDLPNEALEAFPSLT